MFHFLVIGAQLSDVTAPWSFISTHSLVAVVHSDENESTSANKRHRLERPHQEIFRHRRLSSQLALHENRSQLTAAEPRTRGERDEAITLFDIFAVVLFLKNPLALATTTRRCHVGKWLVSRCVIRARCCASFSFPPVCFNVCLLSPIRRFL